MNIFKKLLGIQNKNYTEQTGNDNNALIGNCIIFSLDPNNNEPHIKIRIEDTSNEICSKFGELLYDINNGSYKESIIKLMLQMSGQDTEIKKFMESTIIYWSFLLNKAENRNLFDFKDKPLVMPTDFNKNAK